MTTFKTNAGREVKLNAVKVEKTKNGTLFARHIDKTMEFYQRITDVVKFQKDMSEKGVEVFF